jgi:hypothetical protein
MNLIGFAVFFICLAALIFRGITLSHLEFQLNRTRPYGRVLIAAVLIWLLWFRIEISGANSWAGFFAQIINQLISVATLVVHEAGHVILSHFGTAMGVAGGTIFQVGFPLGLTVISFRIGCTRIGSIFAFWLGHGLIHTAWYIKDAGEIGGRSVLGEKGIHDWSYMLIGLGLLDYKDLLGNIVTVIATLIMISSIGATLFFESDLELG